MTKVLKERGFIIGSENKYYVHLQQKIQELTYYNKDVKFMEVRRIILFEFVLRPKVTSLLSNLLFHHQTPTMIHKDYQIFL